MNLEIKTNNYIHLPNFIDSDTAKQLAIEFKEFTINNQSIGDEQAPNSSVEYNYISFLELLCEKTPEVSKFLGEKVLPTYSYARVYKEGSDLKNELIVISGHYDHLGIRDKKVYNGADDNGSGTSALLELARIFQQAKKDGKGPRRSILIIAFSGEEKGLLGSEYYTSNPVFPIVNTVCDLNIDMIGRIDEKHATGDYVYLIGSDKLSSQLHALSEKVNATYTKLELDYTFNDKNDKNRFYYRSDHYNFAKNGVPVIFYFNGVHADYHEPTDDVEKIDFEKIKKIAEFVFLTAWEIANKDERLVVDSNKE